MRRLLIALAGSLVLALMATPSAAKETDTTLSVSKPCVLLDVTGDGTGLFEITGTWTGTVTFNVLGAGGTIDDVPGISSNTATANGAFLGTVVGYSTMRACWTTPTSGAPHVYLKSAPAAATTVDLSGDIMIGEGLATEAKQDTVIAALAAANTSLDGIEDGISVTLTGVATEAKQDTQITALGTLLTTTAFTTTLSSSPLFLATGADDVVNTQDHLVGFPYWFDGATWDRARGTSADGLLVNLGTNNDVTVTGTDIDVQIGGSDTVQVQSNSLSLVPGLAEDGVHASGEAGALVFGVRQDSQVDFGADGDRVPFSINDAGEVRVAFSGAAGGTSLADDADFSTGTTAFTPVGGLYQSVVTVCTDGDTCAAGITTNREVKVYDETLAGYVDTLEALLAAAANGVYVEDAAATAGGNLQMAGCVRRDTAASSSGTDGDNSTLNCDANGYLWVLDPNSTNILAAVNSAATSLSNIEDALGEDATHGNAVIATGPGIQGEAKSISGGLENAVTVGQSARVAVGTSGQVFTTLVNEAGTLDLGNLIYTYLFALDEAIVQEDAGETTGNGLLGIGAVVRSTIVGSSATNGDNATFNVDTVGRLLTSGAVIEDVAEAGADQLLAMAAVVRATPVGSSATAGDFATLNVSTTGLLYTRQADPCSGVAKTYYVVDTADGTNLEIANAVSGEFFYICSVNLVAAGATVVLISEDDTDGCGSPSAGLNGGSTGTTAEGWSFAANGGIVAVGGSSAVMKTATSNRYLCIDQTASVQLSGTISYVSAP